MTVRCTIFDFVDHGKPQSILFLEDYVVDYHVGVGTPVHFRPSNNTYSFTIGHGDKDHGVRCRVMSIEEREIEIPVDGARRRHDAHIVHLAIEDDSASIH